VRLTILVGVKIMYAHEFLLMEINQATGVAARLLQVSDGPMPLLAVYVGRFDAIAFPRGNPTLVG
jgi:hypothetical protein